MAFLRFQALQAVQQREIFLKKDLKTKHSEIFGKYVFGDQAMRKFLPLEAYENVKASIGSGNKIDRRTADLVAAGMQSWASSMGATHYTHWFQPLTGLTAEKHDAFFDIFAGQGIETFSGKALIQQEPDASSFPSGGIRNTFEARGYTAWDPSSPAFLMSTPAGLTLCIPTIFISYTGEALDYKTPLIKSAHLLEKAVVQVCKLFDSEIKKAHATLGCEQEYFLVDEAMFLAREDLVLTGRTLLGLPPAKGQQLEDHYFGTIPERIHAFMVDLERESMKLGIPLKTRHNEVAPGQFECAPLFEEINLAVDHNQLLMDMIDKIARRHKFRALLHEKPFENINGSGKHCNWSLVNDKNQNLLAPGKTPKGNLQFLTFFINVIKAVNDHADLLRASIATAGNDHRLGANEAPPAIISIFIGTQLSKVLDEIEKGDTIKSSDEEISSELKIDIPKVPEILLDNTDRNRTSPFAFTGNKFELRAVGSSANTASPMIALNTMVANQLMEFSNEVISKIEGGEEKDIAIFETLKAYIASSKKILFEGNNYSEEWVQEAKRRGLQNIKNTPEALEAYLTEKNKSLFTTHKILSARELEARYDILLDHYIKKIQIESRVIGKMALSKVVPASIEYQNKVVEYLKNLNELNVSEGSEEIMITFKKMAGHIKEVKKNVFLMIQERKKANKIESNRERALHYNNHVKPFLDNIRYHSNKLELNVDDDLWKIPKYFELLFLR